MVKTQVKKLEPDKGIEKMRMNKIRSKDDMHKSRNGPNFFWSRY
jgi:hypothetical protein